MQNPADAKNQRVHEKSGPTEIMPTVFFARPKTEAAAMEALSWKMKRDFLPRRDGEVHTFHIDSLRWIEEDGEGLARQRKAG